MSLLTKIPVWMCTLIALAVSCAGVYDELGERRAADRVNTAGAIPMRPLSPKEASVLLSRAYTDPAPDNSPGTAIISLTDKQAVIATEFYLVPGEGYKDMMVNKPYARWRNEKYTVIRASWEQYYIIHRLDRHAVEKAFGAKLSPSMVRKDSFKGWKPSLDTSRIARYFAAEALFLTVLLTALILLVRRFPRFSVLVWGFTAVQIPLLMLVRVYSPAFFDADLFFQRICVETLWVYSYFYLMGPCVLLSFILFFADFTRRIRAFRASGGNERPGLAAALKKHPVHFAASALILSYISASLPAARDLFYFNSFIRIPANLLLKLADGAGRFLAGM